MQLRCREAPSRIALQFLWLQVGAVGQFEVAEVKARGDCAARAIPGLFRGHNNGRPVVNSSAGFRREEEIRGDLESLAEYANVGLARLPLTAQQLGPERSVAEQAAQRGSSHVILLA